jgi:hypothetical protein
VIEVPRFVPQFSPLESNCGERFIGMSEQNVNIADLFLTDLSISVAANLDPGKVGIVAFLAE